MTLSQIVMTELSLGLLNDLYLSSVIALNVSLSFAVFLVARKIRPIQGVPGIGNDFLEIRRSAVASLDGYTLVLVIFTFFAYLWILAAAYFLPPRGIDDLTYHLPTVFEYVQSHTIRLLPVLGKQNFLPQDFQGSFAYPENAELLFMWPILFTHSQQFVDVVNVPVVFLSVLALYALCRHFQISRKNAFFAGLLYALTPVVLMQAGCNYVDVQVVLMLLLAMYYSVRFHSFGEPLDLLAAGLSIGLMCGMKYTAIPLAVPLQILVVQRIRNVRGRHAIAYILSVLLLAGWWYLRNTVVLHDPFFPSARTAGSVDGIFHNIRENLKSWVLLFPFQDIGLGTHDGGFGMVFWCIGFSSWIAVVPRALFHARRSGLQKLIVLAYLPVGFILLLMLPPAIVIWDARLGLIVVAVGIIALCEVQLILQDRFWIAVIKTACVLMCIPVFALLYTAERPSYRFSNAIADAISGKTTSEYKYLMDHPFKPYTELRYIWEPLDYLSTNAGLTCLLVTENGTLCMTGPMYGSKLQNQVLNFREKSDTIPDVYIYTYSGKNTFRITPLPADVRLNQTTTIQGLMAGDEYTVVTQTDVAALLMRREILKLPEQQRLLLAYYRVTWPEAFAAAQRLAPMMDPSIPVVTSSEIGYGLRAFDTVPVQKSRVYLTMERQEEQVATGRRLVRCYTIGRPLRGYHTRKVAHILYFKKPVEVYLNSLRE